MKDADLPVDKIWIELKHNLPVPVYASLLVPSYTSNPGP
jgi:hypothetical protein